MTESTSLQIKDTTANPAPLGLFAFGMTTVLLNMHNAGWFGMNIAILTMGIFYGGAAQVVAGAMEWKKNNTFGTVAFSSYGFFWLTLVGIVLLPKIPALSALGVTDAAHGASFGAYLFMWGVFTFILLIGTFRLSVALQVVFASLTILFFMLAILHYQGLGEGFEHLTGYEGIFCGLSAIYTGAAQVLNEIYGRTVLPLGVVVRRNALTA